MKTLDLSPPPEVAFQYAREDFAEALAEGHDKFMSMGVRLRDALPDIIGGFHALTGNPQDHVKIKPLSSDQTKFIRLLDNHTYGELRFINTFVPEGLQSDLPGYLKALEECSKLCLTVQHDLMVPFNVFLANFSSGNDTIRSLDSQATRWKAVEAERTELVKKCSRNFQGKSARLPYGKLVERNADWASIFRSVDSVYGQMSGIAFGALQSECKKSETFLKLIETNIVEGRIQDASPEVCHALAEGAYQIARSVEFVSMVHYRVLVAFNMVEKTVEEVRRVLKA